VHQRPTGALGQAPDGVLRVAAPQDGRDLGLVVVDHVLEGLLLEGHPSHGVESLVASNGDDLFLGADLGLGGALGVPETRVPAVAHGPEVSEQVASSDSQLGGYLGVVEVLTYSF